MSPDHMTSFIDIFRKGTEIYKIASCTSFYTGTPAPLLLTTAWKRVNQNWWFALAKCIGFVTWIKFFLSRHSFVNSSHASIKVKRREMNDVSLRASICSQRRNACNFSARKCLLATALDKYLHFCQYPKSLFFLYEEHVIWPGLVFAMYSTDKWCF